MLLARALVTDGEHRLDDAGALRLAAEIEGHPDNVAPCLLGGFTVAWTEPCGARAVSLPVADGVRPTVFVPAERGLTATARAALPATVPHSDAALNAGRAALLVHALTTDPSLLLPATVDRLHQDYRAAGDARHVCPGGSVACGRCGRCGQWGGADCAGARPSLRRVSSREQIGEIWRLPMDVSGARVARGRLWTRRAGPCCRRSEELITL